MRVSVSDLDQLIWFRRIEDMTLEQLVSRLRREEPPNRAMLMGTAWHEILEEPPEDELVAVERDGFTFLIECDAEITLPQMRELKATKTYRVNGIDVTLVGKVDGIAGNMVTDHKLTARPNVESYAESYQWRAYLDIFDADTFEYVIYHAADKGEQVIIKDVSPFRFYRYPNMRDDLMVGIREFVEFASEHLPEKFEKEAA